MDLLQFFRRFQTDEAGAVTVDWVVLTAAIVTLGSIVMFPIGDGISLYSESVASNISDRTPEDYTYTGK